MNVIQIAANLAAIAFSLPLEKFIKPNHEKSEQLRKEVMEMAVISPVQSTVAPVVATEITEKLLRPLDETIQREQEGDYCLACVPSKHLQRAHDALKDARNIIDSKDVCTQVAEDKIQQAVYELNGAEVDLENAEVSENIRPAVNQLHTQNREVRNFLRADQSGLELCTIQTDKETMLQNLDLAMNNLNVMIKDGYAVSKQHMQERAKELQRARIGAE